MSVRVFYDILNQKGTPAMYTDTLANRPTYGFAGRLFISTDSGQIFEDTGTAWTLVADAGVGGGTLSSVCLNGNTTATGIVITAGGLSSNSITNTGITAGSVVYAGTGGLMSQSNSTFFWDSTNNRLGINNASPGAPLDVHGTGTQIQINGTGSNNSYIQFQNAGVSKWRVGNNYNSAANNFDIFNNGLSSTPLSISSSTNSITLSANVTTTGIQNVQNGLYLGYASGGATALYTNLYGSTNGINFNLANGTGGANFIFQTLAGYNYTFPATTGTLALTSNLSSYLPLTGGTLTGYIFINNSLGSTQIFLPRGSGDVYGTIQTEASGGTFSLGVTSITLPALGTPVITWTSGLKVGINNTNPSYSLDVTGTGRFTGALSGTSATFSSTLNVFNGNIIVRNDTNSTYRGLSLGAATADASEYAYIKYQPNNGELKIWGSPASFGGKTTFWNNDIQWLNVSNSNTLTFTGAATFSSSVTATGAITATQGNFINSGPVYSTTGSVGNLLFTNTYPINYNVAQIASVLDGYYYAAKLVFRTADSSNANLLVDRLIIASGGTATFSSLAGSGTRSVTADASGSLSTSSDSSLKQEDKGYKIEGLAEILQLKPRAYKWLNDIEIRGEEATTEIGFFANEVNSIIPSAAPKCNDGLYGFYDRAVIAALTKAIQEQQAQIQNLQEQINAK